MKKGISLIVLVITIIVIIILAGAVILSLANNNPIDQAQTARMKSDIDSVQSAINMFLAAEMAQAQSAATVTAGTLTNAATGTASYTINGVVTTFGFGTGLHQVSITLPNYSGYTWNINSNAKVTLVSDTGVVVY